LAAAVHHGLTVPLHAATLLKGGWILAIGKASGLLGSQAEPLHVYRSEMAQNFWTAIFAFTASALVTVGLSLVTPQKKSESDLKGLVYSLTPRSMKEDVAWYRRSTTLAVFVLVIALVLTVLFW